MILYHWMNYFVVIGGIAFTYLRFLPPAFIFISGFMVTNVYPAKYGLSGTSLYTRLIMRGVKLLALFTLLNVMANLVFARGYKGRMPGVDGFLHDAATIYTSGNAHVAFGILVPISYLLLLSAGIFLIGRMYRKAIPFVCGALFLLVVYLEIYSSSRNNLMLVGIGLLGVLVGFYPMDKLNAWASYLSVIVCLNIGYMVAVSIWEANYLLLAIGVPLSVILIYLVGVKSKSVAWGGIRDLTILLGKYSLFGYVSQIALLQLLHKGLLYLDLDHWVVWITSFVAAFAMTIIAVRVAHEIRAKSHAMDWLYRVAFS